MLQNFKAEDFVRIADLCWDFSVDECSYVELIERLHGDFSGQIRCLYAGLCFSSSDEHVDLYPKPVGMARKHLCSNWKKFIASKIHNDRPGQIRKADFIGIHEEEFGQFVITSLSDKRGTSACSLLAFELAAHESEQINAIRVMRLVAPHLHAATLKMAVLSKPKHASLTTAEQEIAECLLLGYTNKEMAKLLKKSDATIRNQLHKMFSKLNVRSRSEAIIRITNTLQNQPPWLGT